MIKYKTAESVSTGHPDSCMDYIVNSILDAFLQQDPTSRVAIDGVAKDKYITLGGEITSQADISDDDIKEIITKCLQDIGYTYTPEITLHLFQQSPDIALGTNDEVAGAGDQGTITGYAVSSNPTNIPLEKALADKLVQKMFLNKRPSYDFIKSDMKSQVTLKYDNDSFIVDTVVFACQHTEEATQVQLESIVYDAFTEACDELEIPSSLYENTKFIVNGTGKFILGGPEADSGEVGRKIVVDSYGVSVPVGGGTYNGKDCTKVDRSAAYYARYVAKNLVATHLVDECLITISYCIGLSNPISVEYEFFDTNRIPKEQLINACSKVFDFTPANMIQELNLKSPIFATAGLMCHFGSTRKTSLDGFTITIPWERTDKVDDIMSHLDN